MNKKPLNLLLLALSFLIASCSGAKEESVPIFRVQMTDFVDAITVKGATDPESSLNITVPADLGGTIAWLVEDGTIVEEGDLLFRISADELEEQYDAALRDLESLEAELSKLHADQELQLTLLEAEIRTKDAEVLTAQFDSLQLLFSPENQRRIQELELRKNAIERGRFERRVETTKRIQRNNLRRLDMRIKKKEEEVKKLKSQTEELRVTAPRSGMVIISRSFMNNDKYKVGDDIWAGMTICALPSLDKMRVIISAPETDYKRIEVGNKVEYRFDAMPDNSAFGEIKMKSPVGTSIQGSSRYKVFEIVASVDSFIEIPGAGLSADCRVFQERIPNQLVVPRIAVFDQDSIRVVFVKKSKGFEMREVRTGLSSLKDIIIEEGVLAHEEIALLRPRDSKIKSSIYLSKSAENEIIGDSIETPELKTEDEVASHPAGNGDPERQKAGEKPGRNRQN